MSGKPRILCLHGGGVSAKIFEMQMRYFLKSLGDNFRLVFADGPWPCDMHEDLIPVYSNMGPCYRWANWKPHHSAIDESTAVTEIESTLTKAMAKDEGTGEWVGLLGFSQGAGLSFSILLENQRRLQEDHWAEAYTGVFWKFGIIMAGRAPPQSLSPHTRNNHNYKNIAQLSQWQESESLFDSSRPILRIPTLHVHGLEDPGLDLHRKLSEYFASPENSKVVEWDGPHRIPFKRADIAKITEAILEVAKV
ncbi:hypothetical protein ACLMJK_000765 [Lecanora helva]